MEEVKKQGVESLFCPYEQALALKELGFDEPCIGFFENNGKNSLLVTDSVNFTNTDLEVEGVSSPLYQQAFRWFREKYNLNSFIIDSKSYNWYFNINDMIIDDVVSEVLFFKSYEEAELECLKKLIEIAKKQ